MQGCSSPQWANITIQMCEPSLKPMLMIEHMKMMQMHYLDIWSICFFLGKRLIGPIQVNCFGMGYSRKNNKQGEGDKELGVGWVKTYFFSKKPLIFFLFFSVPLENTFLYSRMRITYHQLLVDSFHKLISMQDICWIYVYISSYHHSKFMHQWVISKYQWQLMMSWTENFHLALIYKQNIARFT